MEIQNKERNLFFLSLSLSVLRPVEEGKRHSPLNCGHSRWSSDKEVSSLWWRKWIVTIFRVRRVAERETGKARKGRKKEPNNTEGEKK